jgi:hypothetical protein
MRLPRYHHVNKDGDFVESELGSISRNICDVAALPQRINITVKVRRYIGARHRVLWARAMMREIAIIIAAVMALSAMTRGGVHFVPRPTGSLPAVNVP